MLLCFSIALNLLFLLASAQSSSSCCQALLSTRQLLQRTDLIQPVSKAEFFTRFHLGEKLGAGSSGFVVSAVDTISKAQTSSPSLAAKFIRIESPADRRRLLAELTANRRLGLDRGALLLNDSCAALMTPRRAGGSLRLALNRLQRRRGFGAVVEETAALRFATALLRQLRRMHSVGLVHADIKPENIVLTDSNDIASLTIVDFGSVISGGISTARTADYAAPELPGVVSPAADIWSAGIVLREVLMGSHHRANRTPASRLMADFLAQLTRIRPEDRPTSAQALRHPWLLNWRRRHALKTKVTSQTIA